MTEGMMPATIGLRADDDRKAINIRKKRAQHAPSPQFSIRAADVPQHPSQRGMRFKMHDTLGGPSWLLTRPPTSPCRRLFSLGLRIPFNARFWQRNFAVATEPTSLSTIVPQWADRRTLSPDCIKDDGKKEVQREKGRELKGVRPPTPRHSATPTLRRRPLHLEEPRSYEGISWSAASPPRSSWRARSNWALKTNGFLGVMTISLSSPARLVMTRVRLLMLKVLHHFSAQKTCLAETYLMLRKAIRRTGRNQSHLITRYRGVRRYRIVNTEQRSSTKITSTPATMRRRSWIMIPNVSDPARGTPRALKCPIQERA